MLKLFLKLASVSIEEKCIALNEAICFGAFESVKLLLAADSDLILAQSKNGTFLHLAIQKEQLEIAKYLIDLDITLIEMANDDGLFPLHFAALVGYEPIFIYLYNLRAEFIKIVLNSQNKIIDDKTKCNGESVLYFAVYGGNSKIIEFLLNTKPDLAYITDNDGHSILHIAAFHGHLNTIKIILEFDTDIINLISNEGHTALHFAAENDFIEIAKLLLDKKPELFDVLNCNAISALDVAVHHKHYALATYLKNFKSDF